MNTLQASAPPLVPPEEAAARALIDHLVRGDVTAATSGFDATMAGALPPEKLGAVWQQIVGQVGAFEAVTGVETSRAGAHTTVLVTCRFARASLVAKVVTDAQGKVAGLFFVPAASAAPWAPPSYARPELFTERAVTVGASPALPGTLTLPKGSGRVPAVVLVHGSGPNDADESIGGAKVFKDLAWGLASHGVAVLRYVKRSRVAPTGIVTEKEEVLDAVRDAIALLRATPEVDPSRVFVVGHSQGGGLGPRIATENAGLAGLVVMAGNTRPLQDLVVDQTTYILSLAPEDPGRKQAVLSAHALKARLDDPALPADAEISVLGSAPIKGSYFLAMRGPSPAEVAARLSLPILVLQGDRDYQVTAPDLDGWKRALSGKKNVAIKQYPRLNHLFIAGSGPSRPEEYAEPGHVDEEVVRDIATFASRVPAG
jgi:dienelactone hydrolase